MKTVDYNNFLGINRRVSEVDMSTKAGRWVREAVNVDIGDSGRFRRRRSINLIEAMSVPHSMFGGFMVRGSALYSITLPSYSETFVRYLAGSGRMSYTKINDLIFMSNGVDALRTNLDGQVVPWGMATPAAPALAPISGAMGKGEYLVAVSYSNCEEESGISNFSRVETEGGIRVSLPAGVEGATHINIYATGNAGNVPMLAATVEVGETIFDITTKVVGREIAPRVEDVLPAGSRVFEFNGRLCSVQGDTLYYGTPYKHGYYEPGAGYIRFGKTIQIAAANQSGIYLAVEGRTMFLQGNDAGGIEFVRDVFPYGAVPGTEFEHPKKSHMGWFGKHGIVVGDESGQVADMMESKVSITAPASGASVVLTDGGIDRVVSCGWCVNLVTGALTQYADFPITSGSGRYGTAPDGVYSLDGNSPLDARIYFGKEDFGSGQEKHIVAAYLGAASTDLLSLKVGTSSNQSYTYPARSFSEKLDVVRVDTGKGLKSNWYEFEVGNVSGCDFQLESASFAPTVSSRRI